MTTDAQIVIGIRGDVSGGRVIKRTLDDIENSERRAQGAGANLRSEFGRMNTAANSLANALRTLGLAFGIRELGLMADAYTTIQNRLKLVTNNTQELQGVTRELFEISNSTRQSFTATAEVYSRMALATKELGLSQQETLQFSKSLNQAVLLSGASSAEASAGLIQLSQGLASGTLRGDELRSVLEQLPAVADVIARGLGVTRGELRKMGEDGKITADQVISAFKLAAAELDASIGRTVPTLAQAFEILRNKVILAVGDFNQATGTTDFLSIAIVKLGDVVSVVMNDLAALAQMLQGIFTAVVGSILSITTEITNGIEKVVNVGVAGLNVFRREKLSPVDFNNGLTGADIVAAQTEMEFEKYRGARESLLRANQSAANLFGTTTSYQRPGEVSTQGGPRRTPAAEISDEQIKAQKAIDKVTESLRFQIEQLRRNDVEQAIYNNLKQAGVDIDSAAGQNIRALTIDLETNTQQLEKQRRIVDGVSGAFEGFFKSAIQGADGFKGAIKGLIGSLADMVFQMTVIEPIKNNLFGAAGGGLSGIFGSLFGGGGMTASSFAARQAANVGTGLYGPGFASGGSMILGGRPGIDQNQLSLNGSPIARVGRGETLTISPERKNGGGVIVNQTINLSMGVAAEVAAQIAAAMPEIRRTTQSAIEDAQLRGISA